MENVTALPKTIIKTNSIAAINFTIVFVALSVALPMFAHHFKLAGPTYLPMHFFVLFAGLLLGWRTGLIVGLFTPLISYAVSGMPPMVILPQTVLEVALYGFIAGLVREKLHLNLYWSLLVALVIGRFGALLGIVLFNTMSSHPVSDIMQSVKMGWPGLLIQLALIPLAVYLAKRYFNAHYQQTSA